tara:strand:- start:212 stop:1705 length:1494 start_codon:yes stop_codon:yes gene_type:complete
MEDKFTLKEYNKQHFFACNVNSDVKIRREMFEDVEHLVVPVIAAKEMVMNGYFYPAEEFRNWAETWNGVPVPISHPEFNGNSISARSPRIQELTSVGYFFNVSFTKDNKLKGEIWINISKAEKLNADYIVDNFESGEIMEVSTGLYSNVELVPGEFEGVPYKGIIRDIRPDHLALLPNEVGACSIEDGCGAMKNNCKCKDKKENTCACKEPKGVIDKLNKALKLVGDKLGLNTNKESFSEVKNLVENALSESLNKEYVFILDIYDNSVIYEAENAKGTLVQHKVGYIIDNGSIVLGDDAHEVVRKTEYMPIKRNDKQINKESSENMDKEQIIHGLITNSTNTLTEDDKSSLESLDEALLSKLSVNEETEEAPAEEPVTEEAESDNKDEEPKTEEPEGEESTEQKLNKLLDSIHDEEVKALVSNAVSKADEARKVLVEKIIENSEFTQEELSSFSFNQLEKIGKTATKQDFSGRGTSLIPNKKEEKIPSMFDGIEGIK